MDQQSRILIADDDEATRYVKSHLLRRQGHAVFEARTGREALSLVATERPDLALLDVLLPDISGVEVCRDIKSRFPQTVVLQTSAVFTGIADRTRALEGGADSYLVEPIEPDELVATVNALLRMHDAEQKVRRINRDLERLVAERTCELVEANRRLSEEIAERQKAEAVLLNTEKLDLMGQLAGGIAHDFNNILTVVSGNLQLVQQAMQGEGELPAPQRSRLRRLLGAIEAATDHAAKMIQQLLVFARPTGFINEPDSLAELLRNLESFVRRAAGEAVAVMFECAGDLWHCRINAVQVEAAILNLVVNARDAMPRGGKLRIGLTNVAIREGDPCDSDIPAGDYVRIVVSDTGDGMAPDIIEHVFEPFFTTKKVGKGSGLGLSQVYGFVKQSGGHIRVASTPGEGTTFRLYLPRAEEAAEPPASSGAETGDVPGGSETVLIVEDNQNVREVAESMVASLGYKAFSVADAGEALALIDSPREIHLMLSDIVMSGEVDGFALAHRARALRPELPVLLMSGYPRAGAAESGEFPILRKPYHLEELARHIRAALRDARLRPRNRDCAGNSPPGIVVPGSANHRGRGPRSS